MKKKDITERANRLRLQMHGGGMPLGRYDLFGRPNEDYAFLEELLGHHPEADAKLGNGIDYFTTVKVGAYNSVCLAVVRRDGTVVDFSIAQCVAPKSHKDMLVSAMRNHIDGQISEFRQTHVFHTMCDECSENPSTVVDHDFNKRPFKDIVSMWMEQEGLSAEQVKIKSSGDGYGKVLADAHQIMRWQKFHRDMAILRWVCFDCNSRKNKRLK